MNTHDYNNNVAFQHNHMARVQEIIRAHAGLFVAFRLANEIEDTKQSTDAVLEMSNKATIAVRIRRHRNGKLYRDLTIRAQTKSGGKTELSKLREGWGDWYFYAWLDANNQLTEYMLVDLHAMRASGRLAQNKRVIQNGDGTGFVEYSIAELYQCNALVFADYTDEKGYRRQMARQQASVPMLLPGHLKRTVAA